MTYDLQKIKEQVDAGNLWVSPHPSLPLTLYKYAPEAVFKKQWNEITLNCRGLVLDASGNVVVNCMPKFFNDFECAEEVEKRLKAGMTYTVTEKMDGSLIQVVKWNGQLLATSSGSFTSKQAQRALELINNGYPINNNLTHVYELIYPENRIVVNYGDMVSLRLICIRDTDSGAELASFSTYHPNAVATVDLKWEQLQEMKHDSEWKNIEGWVVRFEDGYRVKIKTDRYMELHKAISGINEKYIWELCKDGKKLDECFSFLPDEIFTWAEGQYNKFQNDFAALKDQAAKEFATISNLVMRKDFAREACKSKFKAALFMMYDQKIPDMVFWSMLEPKVVTKFGRGEEA